jgi:transposase InsO family protein
MHQDSKRYVASCTECQRTGNISQRNVMPLNYNLQINLFDIWGIDFTGPFTNSNGYEYILVMVDYVSKWVEAIPCRRASMEESISMIKNVIFPRYGVSRVLISDGGTHFTGNSLRKCLSKLWIEHRVATAYHPQTNGRKLQIGNSRVFLTRPLRREVKIGRNSWTEHNGHIGRHTRHQ